MVGAVDWSTESRLISATNSEKRPYADGGFFCVSRFALRVSAAFSAKYHPDF